MQAGCRYSFPDTECHSHLVCLERLWPYFIEDLSSHFQSSTRGSSHHQYIPRACALQGLQTQVDEAVRRQKAVESQARINASEWLEREQQLVQEAKAGNREREAAEQQHRESLAQLQAETDKLNERLQQAQQAAAERAEHAEHAQRQHAQEVERLSQELASVQQQCSHLQHRCRYRFQQARCA